MNTKLSRRDFLKLTGAALGGLAFSPYLPPRSEFEDSLLVRVTSSGEQNRGIPVYSKPADGLDDPSSYIRRVVNLDNILNVYEEVNSGNPAYNPIWYRVWGGYVHRARMQKVQMRYNAPAESIRENGQLGEVTVPFTQSVWFRRDSWQRFYRLYYETIHWVVGIDEGPDGQPWYRLKDELDKSLFYNVPATHIRLIKDEEFSPISVDVPPEQKRIEVSLGTQIMTCFEYDQVVFQTNISSGRVGTVTPPGGIPTRTPVGKAHITNKLPSKHMGDGQLASDIDAYELVGVPWTVFIKYDHLPFQGHAFHGTYWHDNYGVPMSSGCINMRNDEAKWFFRWCLPKAGAEDIRTGSLDRPGRGTNVVVKI